ncbi:hypothetical protein [Candidatus Neptunochlamydia vexilliferae]|uniref:Riboflavin biosynthesis protein n=1 Tax=Candidatus Neptunichlamydia vexilliferae TaxID=1651774 RepID=A0ABS0AWL6_9BACT|nr:hypothetical protein [Candidatus Neptunochlamydia vexilliferae]MBF5058533.1 hypothetical protein [Candidatus Neptunochlamydia vexilliferae]
MNVVHSLDQIPELQGPIALSIGTYDGVHLGHQMIIKRLRKETRKKGSTVLLTFLNHPSTYLSPNAPVPLITTTDHRIALLKEAGVDLVIALPFNQTFARQSYQEFFTALKEKLPFDHLIVGEDARFGKERAGGPDELQALGIPITYLKKDGISSGAIRQLIEKGELKKVKKMLGRPYIIRLPFDQGNVIRENDGQYRWETGVSQLSLLPSAVYGVDLMADEKKVPGIAFYRGTQNIQKETELSLTLYFEKELPAAPFIDITFLAYLHDELDPNLSLGNFKTEPSLV